MSPELTIPISCDFMSVGPLGDFASLNSEDSRQSTVNSQQ